MTTVTRCHKFAYLTRKKESSFARFARTIITFVLIFTRHRPVAKQVISRRGYGQNDFRNVPKRKTHEESVQNQCLSLLNMQICDVLPVLVIDKARYGRLKVSKRHCCQPTVILSYTYQPFLSFFKAEFTKIKTSAKKNNNNNIFSE